MTVRTTRWTNDTCGCVIDYTWDDSLPQDQIVINFSNVVSRCSVHKGLSSGIDVWNAIQEENPRKNIALQLLLDNGPNTLYDLQEGINKILKQNIQYNFSFSGTHPNRVLNISLNGVSLTTQQKNTIQNILNNRFGAGKVILS